MLADITVNTETMVVVSGVVGALVTAIVFLFFMVLKGYQDALTEEKADTASWKQMAVEAMGNLENATVKIRELTGAPQPPALIAVIPERSSPPTEKQVATADIATMRARLVAANLNMGLEEKEEPDA